MASQRTVSPTSPNRCSRACFVAVHAVDLRQRDIDFLFFLCSKLHLPRPDAQQHASVAPANPGICIDRDGAMLGPDCVLVGRTLHGFRSID
jgi:hypothetical protein